jgi:hypothetical protein
MLFSAHAKAGSVFCCGAAIQGDLATNTGINGFAGDIWVWLENRRWCGGGILTRHNQCQAEQNKNFFHCTPFWRGV